RHSRGLGWGAPVSGRQFLAFRLLRGGFRAPVSAGDFPISVSVRLHASSSGRIPWRGPLLAVQRTHLGLRLSIDSPSALFAKGNPSLIEVCEVKLRKQLKE